MSFFNEVKLFLVFSVSVTSGSITAETIAGRVHYDLLDVETADETLSKT